MANPTLDSVSLIYVKTATITMSDGTTQETANVTVTPYVAPPATLIVAANLPNGDVGVAYNGSAQASGGTVPYTYSALGLAPGLAINSQTGAISGTPTTAGSYSAMVTVTDSAGDTAIYTAPYSIVVPAPIFTVTPMVLPEGKAGVLYSQQLVATGGTAPYTWQVIGGALPAGITLSPSGLLSGTYTDTQFSFANNFYVKVSDSSSPIQTVEPATGYSLVINL